MLENPPKRLAASITKRRSSVCRFHSSTTTRPISVSAPKTTRSNSPSLASRLFRKSIKTSLLVDQLGISLALPVPIPVAGLSDIAILTLSAALRFRTDIAPLGFGLDTSRSKARMLVEEKAPSKPPSISEGETHPVEVVAGPSGPPPAYRKVDLPNNHRGPRQDEFSDEGGKLEEGLPSPTNFAHVYRRDGRIHGRWNIDPNMNIPAVFLPSSDEDARTGTLAYLGVKKADVKAEEVTAEPMPNLKLHSRDGRIIADVSIVGTQTDESNTKPTLVDVYTRDGGIVLRLRTRGPAPLHVKAYTHDGAIRVFLPRDFNGILTHKLRDGSVIASPAMKKPGGITTFTSIDGGVGHSFVGQWKGLLDQPIIDGKGSAKAQEAEALQVDAWTGDRCEVSSRDGNAYFYWEDEYDDVTYRLTAKGWLQSLFSPRG